MNKVGDIFNAHEAVCRGFDVPEIHRYISGSGPTRAWSWGFRKPTAWKDVMYTFRVSGHHHKGLVNIVLDGSDTFTIYYTTLITREIKKVREMVYIDQLLEILDKDIERIGAYAK